MIDEKPLIKFKFLELQRKLIFILLFTLLFHQAFSEETDLIEIYNKALAHDALLASVKFENQATQELISQGRSLFLPSITANICLLYTSPSPRDLSTSRMPSSA